MSSRTASRCTTPPKILVICGPTASGKSELALRLAEQLNGEIVNADSMQVYRGMDIGTAKPSCDERARVPHHLLDVAEPGRLFSAADFAEAADSAIADIVARGKRAIVVGGTGLYIRALVKGLVDSPSGAGQLRADLQEEAARRGGEAMLEELRRVDPEAAERMHPNNLVRIVRALEVYRMTGIPLSRYQREHGFGSAHYQALQIGLQVDRPELYRRIEERVERMVQGGLEDEVRRLLAQGWSRELKSMRSIGYKEMGAFLSGESTWEEAVERIKRDTRRYAKRQLTWFKADPDILWLEYPAEFDTILEHAIEFFMNGE